jgi:N6-adenosine-specific RNA methylase IME4
MTSKEIILAPTHGVITETGWSPPEAGISREQLLEAGRYVARLHGATGWVLGDIWLHALKRKYGEGEKLAAELGVSYAMIRKLASICKSYELFRRRNNPVTFTHHEAALTLKNREQRDEWLAKAEANKWSVRDFRLELLKARRVRAHQEFARPNFDRTFALLYADPPWQFKTRSPLGGEMTSPDNHYQTQDIEWVCDLKIGDKYVSEIAADDAVLFLWTTSPFLMLANRVIEAWGFKYSTSFVWDKQVSGTGYIALGQHEHLLYAARGEPPRPLKVFPSVFPYRRGRHSAKPPEIRQHIEEMFPSFKQGERLEMFARGKVPGWSVWGNEAVPILSPDSNVAQSDPGPDGKEQLRLPGVVRSNVAPVDLGPEAVKVLTDELSERHPFVPTRKHRSKQGGE